MQLAWNKLLLLIPLKHRLQSSQVRLMHLYVVPQEIDSIHILTRNCRFYCCFGQILCWTSSISCKNSCSPRVGQFLRRGAFSTAAADESILTKGKQKCNFPHPLLTHLRQEVCMWPNQIKWWESKWLVWIGWQGVHRVRPLCMISHRPRFSNWGQFWCNFCQNF